MHRHPENIVPDYALDRDLEVQCIDNALVMPIVAASSEEAYFFRGGVYNQNGDFSAISGLRRLQDNIVVGPYPKSVINDTKAAKAYSEPAVFCGNLDGGFGHFLLESVSRLWWGIINNFQGSYVFQIRRNQKISTFMTEFFELLGIAGQVLYVKEPTLESVRSSVYE